MEGKPGSTPHDRLHGSGLVEDERSQLAARGACPPRLLDAVQIQLFRKIDYVLGAGVEAVAKIFQYGRRNRLMLELEPVAVARLHLEPRACDPLRVDDLVALDFESEGAVHKGLQIRKLGRLGVQFAEEGQRKVAEAPERQLAQHHPGEPFRPGDQELRERSDLHLQALELDDEVTEADEELGLDVEVDGALGHPWSVLRAGAFGPAGWATLVRVSERPGTGVEDRPSLVEMAVATLALNKNDETLGCYSLGFLDSAVALFKRADAGLGMVDLAFYPAAFSLRHGLELFIKQMSVYLAYEMRDPSLLYKKLHGLKEVWDAIRGHVQEQGREAACGSSGWAAADIPHHLDVVESLILTFHEIDPAGTLFRYPENVFNKNGERTLLDTHVPFDLVNLSDWSAISSATLEAAQLLLGFADDRATWVANRRGDVPRNFHQLVLGPDGDGRG